MNIPKQFLHPDFRFAKLLGRAKRPFDKEWQKHPYTLAEMESWITAGANNWGIATGHGGLIVLDADSQAVRDIAEQKLPATFTVQTGSGKKHFYFFCPEVQSKISFYDKLQPSRFIGDEDHYGEILSLGQQAVAPSSVHPDTGKPYIVANDIDIATITKEQLLAAVDAFLLPNYFEKKDYAVHAQNEWREVSPIDSLDVLCILRTYGVQAEYHGKQLQTSHPIHGSENGMNFAVHPEKNAWFCFRCNSGGGPMSLIAVLEGIIDCSEAARGGLRGQKFIDTKEVAKKKYGLEEENREQKNDQGKQTVNSVKKKSKLNPISLAELFAMDFPEAQWQIERLLPTGQITVISGPPSSHKSMVGSSAAISVASGEKLFDFFNVTQGKVLIVNEDGDTLRDFKKRLVALDAKNDLPIYLSVAADFKIEEGDVSELIKYAKEKSIKFIIFDSFRSMLPKGLKENDSGDVRQAINNLRPLTKEGITILIIHHDRKKPIGIAGYFSTDPNDLGEMMAGSADIRGAIDCHIAIASKKTDDNNYDVILTQTKCRADELIAAFKVLFKKDEESIRFIHNGAYSEAEDNLRRVKIAIMALFKKIGKDYIPIDEIIKSKPAGAHDRIVRDAIRDLEIDGKISHKNGKELNFGGSHLKHYYFIASGGVEEGFTFSQP